MVGIEESRQSPQYLALTGPNCDFLSRTTTQGRGTECHCLLKNTSTQEEQDSITTQ